MLLNIGFTVHTQVDKNTVDYAEFMWKTMLDLAHNPENIRLVVHSIGFSCDNARFTASERVSINTINIVATGVEGTSLHHARCIEAALKMTGDHNIHVICDSDTVVLARGWDMYVQRVLLSSGGYDFIGTSYESYGGFSSGTGTVQTYKNKPTFTWCALSPRRSFVDLDVMPDKNKTITITNDELSSTYGLPIGMSVYCEAGWRVPQYIVDNNIKFDAWVQKKPSGDAVVLYGLNDYHEEFHVDNVNGTIPFVAHQRGSLRHAYRVAKLSAPFYERIDAHLALERNRLPKW